MHISCFGYTSEQRSLTLNDTPDEFQPPANKKFNKFVRTSIPVSLAFSKLSIHSIIFLVLELQVERCW